LNHLNSLTLAYFERTRSPLMSDLTPATALGRSFGDRTTKVSSATTSRSVAPPGPSIPPTGLFEEMITRNLGSTQVASKTV
jgi:hypothetical protein